MSYPTSNNDLGRKDITISSSSIFTFKNVSFKYPGNERYVLSNVNLEIKANEILCMVGENGAGKTTFVKLLTRLYKPTDGEILLDGANIEEYNIVYYQKIFAPVFQDFSKYSIPIDLNVALEKTPDQSRVISSLSEVGLLPLIEKMPKGVSTYVGKKIEKDGFEPSGGESQRIAIARALYRNRDFYILDEPTAALDPNAEYEIYTQFHNMIKGKTAILVTHRLSAVQLADKVAVFDNGQIIEYGTPFELYSKGGKYKKMFDKQSEFYVKSFN